MMAWANAGNISGEATGASSNTSIEAMRGGSIGVASAQLDLLSIWLRQAFGANQ